MSENGNHRVEFCAKWRYMNQIKKRTGVDPRTFSGASFLLTLSRLLESHTRDKERL